MHHDLDNKQNVEETQNKLVKPYMGQGRNQRIVKDEFQTVPGWTIYETNSLTGHRFYAYKDPVKITGLKDEKKPNRGLVGEIRKVWFINDRWVFQDPRKGKK